ncbi:hypothetical protein BWD08_06225 [Neisseria animaloris]|nr:hypothetical protein BWD08_06225 [Neisseria animaloris]
MLPHIGQIPVNLIDKKPSEKIQTAFLFFKTIKFEISIDKIRIKNYKTEIKSLICIIYYIIRFLYHNKVDKGNLLLLC